MQNACRWKNTYIWKKNSLWPNFVKFLTLTKMGAIKIIQPLLKWLFKHYFWLSTKQFIIHTLNIYLHGYPCTNYSCKYYALKLSLSIISLKKTTIILSKKLKKIFQKRWKQGPKEGFTEPDSFDLTKSLVTTCHSVQFILSMDLELFFPKLH